LSSDPLLLLSSTPALELLPVVLLTLLTLPFLAFLRTA
jgi:hypothetical protein